MKIVMAILSFAAHAVGIMCLCLWLFAENASDNLIFWLSIQKRFRYGAKLNK